MANDKGNRSDRKRKGSMRTLDDGRKVPIGKPFKPGHDPRRNTLGAAIHRVDQIKIRSMSDFLRRIGIDEEEAKDIWDSVLSHAKKGEKWAVEMLMHVDDRLAEEGGVDCPGPEHLEFAKRRLRELAQRFAGEKAAE